MPPLQIHTAIEQALSTLIYKKEGELEALRHDILEKITTTTNTAPDTTTSTNTVVATTASEKLIQDQQNQEQVERKHQEQNALRSSLLSATNPCIASPVFWWTHRALKSTPQEKPVATTIHTATIERECNQLIALCFHILSHNTTTSTTSNHEQEQS